MPGELAGDDFLANDVAQVAQSVQPLLAADREVGFSLHQASSGQQVSTVPRASPSGVDRLTRVTDDILTPADVEAIRTRVRALLPTLRNDLEDLSRIPSPARR